MMVEIPLWCLMAMLVVSTVACGYVIFRCILGVFEDG